MADTLGFRQTYKQTGHQSSGGGPEDKGLDKGASGSHRDNNWKVGAKQGKVTKSQKIGPDKNLNEIGGGNFY